MGCQVSVDASGSTPSRPGPRGKTYNPALDYRVKQLYAELGEGVLNRVSHSFYQRVHSDKKDDFADAFGMMPDHATRYLTWYLVESWGGPPQYTEKRGTLFPFLYSTHRLWYYKLTPKFWARWIMHYRHAAAMVCAEENEGLETTKSGSAAAGPPSAESADGADGDAAVVLLPAGERYVPPPSPPATSPVRFNAEHLQIMNYFVLRLQEWLDCNDVDIKKLELVGHFDDVKQA